MEKLRETDGVIGFWFSPTDGWPPNGGGQRFSAPSFRGIKRPFPFSIATIPGQVPVSCVVESAPIQRHVYNCRLVGKIGAVIQWAACAIRAASSSFRLVINKSDTCARLLFLTWAHPPSGFRTREGTDQEATQGQGVLTCWDLVEWAIYCW